MRKHLAWLHRHRRWIGTIILVVFVLPFLVLHLAVAPYLGTKIEQQVRARLHCQITTGFFLYHFPYGLTAHGVHIQLPQSDGGQTVDVDSIAVTLTKLPLGDGPMIIRDLTVEQPTVKFTPRFSTTRPSTAPSNAPTRISDTLRLHHLIVQGGQVIVQDPREGVMRWGGIDIDINAAQRGTADYDFNLTAQNGQTADFTATGQFNVDQRQALLQNYAITVRSDDRPPGQLPPQFQHIWRKYRVRGTLRVDGSAQANLVDPTHNSFVAKIQLQDGTAYSPQIDSTLDDLAVVASAYFKDGKMSGQLEQFSARSGDAELSLNSGINFAADDNTGTWSIDKICGKVAIESPSTRPSENSKPLFGHTHPSGKLVFWGHAGYTGQPNKSPDYQIFFTSDQADFWSERPRLQLSQISIDGRFLGDHFHLRRFQAQAFGGIIAARGDLSLKKPYPYSLDVDTHDASLLAMATAIDPASAGGHLQGILRLQAQFAGKFPDNASPFDQLHGKGRFAISQGNLWDTPVLQQIEKRLSIARAALTVGRAYARFTIAKRRVDLTDATVSAPVLGLQGYGSVDFNANLDFHLVAVPLQSWRYQLRKANIPIVGGVLSATADKLQQILNSATSTLLYEFHVSGVANNPRVSTIPAPVLSVSAVNVFKEMLSPQPENVPTQMPPDAELDSATDSSEP